MKSRMSSRPRRGACNEYCNSMSGAASWSMTLGFQVLPQNSVNHRPTIALLLSRVEGSATAVCVVRDPAAMADAAADTPFSANVRRLIEFGDEADRRDVVMKRF